MKQSISIVLLFFFILVSSCKDEKSDIKKTVTETKKSSVKETPINKLTNTKVNSEGVYLFSNKNDIIINWTEWSKEGKTNQLKFTYLDKKTNLFREEQTVISALGLQIHAESMAKVGINKTGILYAVYRRKSNNPKQRFGGLLYYSISKDKGKTWSKEQKLVTDQGKLTLF